MFAPYIQCIPIKKKNQKVPSAKLLHRVETLPTLLKEAPPPLIVKLQLRNMPKKKKLHYARTSVSER